MGSPQQRHRVLAGISRARLAWRTWEEAPVAERETAVPRLLSLPPDLDTLAGRLRLVIDPELGVNIVDLGLVYRAKVVDGVAHVLCFIPARVFAPGILSNGDRAWRP